MDFNFSYSEVYGVESENTLIFLRIISDALVAYLPWLMWVNFILNFLNINLDINLSFSALFLPRFLSFLNFFLLMLTDLVLYIIINRSRSLKLKQLAPYDNLRFAMNREYRKNRAKLLADLLGLLLSSLIIVINLALIVNNEDLPDVLRWKIPLLGSGLSLFLIKEAAVKLKGKY